MGSIAPAPVESYDVIVVGAGVSGVNSGYRLQTECPGQSYTILEARTAIGGTWDLFRYPGIRSDSDLHTFGFPWRPWDKSQSIVSGTDIRNYVKESAEAFGIDKKIQFKHKLIQADWSSKDQSWSLVVDADGKQKLYRAGYILFSTGYYDYDTPLQTDIPGIDNFAGKRIHPQFWPEDLQYAGKKIVVIGSGATAVTLIPNLAEKAELVTMLQRSPSYVLAQPGVDPLGNFLRSFLPSAITDTLTRWKFLVIPLLFFYFCRAFPGAARKILRIRTKGELPSDLSHDPHFNPRYNPWEQRLCVCPDGDFFKALRSHKATVVTDTIREVQKNGISLNSGKFLPADIIVTATGLKVRLAGGARLSIDGKPFSWSDGLLWRGIMVSGLPNAATVIGYTNASWTLGADCTALLVCRILNHMRANNFTSATPVTPQNLLEGPGAMKIQSSLNLNSTYIEKAKGEMPLCGDRGAWAPRKNFIVDRWNALHCDLEENVKYAKGVEKKVK